MINSEKNIKVGDSIINMDDLDTEITAIRDVNVTKEEEKEIDKKTSYQLVTIQKEFLRIKVFWIIVTLLLKLLYKIIFLIILYVLLKISVFKSFILDIYFAHYLFFFMFVLFTIDIIFVLTKFMSDVQEILIENIYIETVTKQEKVLVNT